MISFMKTSLRFPRIVSAAAALSLASVALAQPPPRNPSDSGAGAGPVPSPGRPGSGYPAPLGRIVIPAPDAPPPHRRYVRDARDSGETTVVQIQRALKSCGYYAGPVDGDAGAGTRAAIRHFRRDHGLGSSTKIDGELTRALRQ